MTSDSPALLTLLSTIIVVDNLTDAHENFCIEFETQRFPALPVTTPGSVAEAGQSLVALVFEPNGEVDVVRIKRWQKKE